MNPAIIQWRGFLLPVVPNFFSGFIFSDIITFLKEKRMVRYEFTFSDERLLSVIKILLKYRSRNYIGKSIKIIASICLALLAIIFFIATPAMGIKMFVFGLFFTALIFLLFTAHKIDYWLIKRRFRKSPFRNEHFQISISSDGLHTVTSKSDEKLKWSVFSKAIRIDENIILGTVWLPKKELVEGTIEEADSLIKANIKNYEIKKINNFSVTNCLNPSTPEIQ